MKTLILFFLLVLTLSFKSDNNGCLRLDILLVGDYSYSCDGKEHFIVDAFKAFANRFKLSEEDFKIGIITFEETATIRCPLTSDPILFNDAIKKLENLKANGAGTNITLALRAAFDELHSNGRQHTTKIIILVSDGLNNNGEADPVKVADQIKITGTTICTVLVDKESNATNATVMKYIATSGWYVESSYGTLIDELKTLDICL